MKSFNYVNIFSFLTQNLLVILKISLKSNLNLIINLQFKLNFIALVYDLIIFVSIHALDLYGYSHFSFSLDCRCFCYLLILVNFILILFIVIIIFVIIQLANFFLVFFTSSFNVLIYFFIMLI